VELVHQGADQPPVTGWGNVDDPQTQKLSSADMQELTNYLYNALVKAFGEKYALVDPPGPGVLRVSTAITDGDAAAPGLCSVSMAIPQVRVRGTLKYAATGTYPFLGTALGQCILGVAPLPLRREATPLDVPL
jgi:hypothetical protein